MKQIAVADIYAAVRMQQQLGCDKSDFEFTAEAGREGARTDGHSFSAQLFVVIIDLA